MEAIGAVSIMPFIALVSDHTLIESYHTLNILYNLIEPESYTHFIVLVGFIVIFVISLSSVIRVLTLTKTLGFIFTKEADLSNRMLRALLNLNYLNLIEYKKDEMKKIIFSDVNKIVVHVMQPVLIIFSGSMVVIVLVITLFLIQPRVTLILSFISLFYFGAIYVLIKRKLENIGQEKFNADSGRFNVLENALSDIKTLKIEKKFKSFSDYFSHYATLYADNYAKGQIIAQLPRYFLEFLLFGGLVGLIITLSINSEVHLNMLLPTIAIFAIAGYKIVPSANNIFYNLAILRTSILSLNEYSKKYKTILENDVNQNVEEGHAHDSSPFEKFELRGVYYEYEKGNKLLQDINLQVNKTEFVCLTGKSGSGKTSLLDIIAGLINPTSGEVFVNGDAIKTVDIDAWQRNIAYVPQSPVFFGGSLESNIIGDNIRIGKDELFEIIRAVCLDDFLINDSAGLTTNIGDFGAKLSGGQKQRLALARALAKHPSVLLLDEATSALDIETEKAILNNLQRIENLTVIMIAHRKECMKISDSVYRIEQGKLSKIYVY